MRAFFRVASSLLQKREHSLVHGHCDPWEDAKGHIMRVRLCRQDTRVQEQAKQYLRAHILGLDEKERDRNVDGGEEVAASASRM